MHVRYPRMQLRLVLGDLRLESWKEVLRDSFIENQAVRKFDERSASIYIELVWTSFRDISTLICNSSFSAADKETRFRAATAAPIECGEDM
ncbi:hypothetical protein NPIL_546501 [Nephila pilipes]|uniref:Uncharacterized protein n=1 Tax=Nephila pilipes TaxID=299642 RepID=A0A8X6M9R2_NEPPI|nr:hypothetical protein NPIL_546501 [Nephila pilipes]